MRADDAVTAGLAVGLASRLTRLVTRDTFPPVKAARDRVEERFGDEHPITYLVHCDWCSGYWVSLLVGTSAAKWGDKAWWRLIAGVFTLSMIAPVVVDKTDGEG